MRLPRSRLILTFAHNDFRLKAQASLTRNKPKAVVEGTRKDRSTKDPPAQYQRRRHNREITMMKPLLLLPIVWKVQSIHGFMLPNSRLPHRPEATSLRAASEKFALLFDCDGVIIETEELHRLAYNAAFKEFDLQIGDEPVEWSVAYYDILQNTGEP